MKACIGLLVLLSVAFANGVDAGTSERRVLGGYRFVPTSNVRDPFTTTYFRNATDVSIASGVNIPVVVVPTEPPDTVLSLEGNYVFVVADIEYQYGFNDRVALRGSGFGASRVGTSGQSLLAQGVTATWGAELGTTIALWNNENMMLSALLDLRFGKVLAVDLIGYVEDIVAGSTLAPSLVKAEDRTTLLGGLAGAWAFNDWSGLHAFGEIGQANGAVTGGNAVWGAGLAASMDFGQRDQAPVGLLASAAFVQAPNVESFAKDVTSVFGLGVYYTGRDDLNVGGEVKWSAIPLEVAEVEAKPITFSAVFRYFF